MGRIIEILPEERFCEFNTMLRRVVQKEVIRRWTACDNDSTTFVILSRTGSSNLRFRHYRIFINLDKTLLYPSQKIMPDLR